MAIELAFGILASSSNLIPGMQKHGIETLTCVVKTDSSSASMAVELDLGWELDGDVHGKWGQISMVGEAQP
jgi:hypothetical protein